MWSRQSLPSVSLDFASVQRGSMIVNGGTRIPLRFVCSSAFSDKDQTTHSTPEFTLFVVEWLPHNGEHQSFQVEVSCSRSTREKAQGDQTLPTRH